MRGALRTEQDTNHVIARMDIAPERQENGDRRWWSKPLVIYGAGLFANIH
jgi:hypothetical protein